MLQREGITCLFASDPSNRTLEYFNFNQKSFSLPTNFTLAKYSQVSLWMKCKVLKIFVMCNFGREKETVMIFENYDASWEWFENMLDITGKTMEVLMKIYCLGNYFLEFIANFFSTKWDIY